MTTPVRTWAKLLAALLRGDDLTTADTHWAMGEVMKDNHEPVAFAGFLVALRAKGETAAEISGLLDALMERVVPLPVDGSRVVDIVGTGGDGAHTVNISTMAAIVTAAAGAPVVKNGGRSVSSKSGSADVLEALGLPLYLGPEQVARCLTDLGLGFTFAPTFHQGLKHAAPVRRTLGVPTAINYLAPLTNPARPGAALVGCSNPQIAPVLAAVLAERDASALVVRGHDGLDEITTAAPTDVWATTAGGGVRTTTLDTARFGLARPQPDALRGGDADYNARVVHTVLSGAPGAARDAVLANAAGALAAHSGIAGRQASLEDAFADGLDRARTAVDSGAAADLLERWITLASTVAEPR
ncbi:anthranilate phosphoribosyltransferase [Actinoalloteichus fjordicus]|uniref:Anthranilate phosphoribosyltransferase n=1 Tax=Actinoalloteichus fjordicus TaxID=1612552 RepID=A0AAC9LE65_9PSEU|nr:anthranilate phosphoribosyltransferase [Actinoalloteichus fjordicus]APU15210.1 anthranilate phosphoribosyltransferase [Actinoalloteichus fjordicus]